MGNGRVELPGFAEVSGILQSGVYALVKRGVVIYVGKSKSLYQRIYAHRTTASRAAKGKSIPTWMPIKGFVFDQVFILPCPLAELDSREAEMIDRYRPRFNQSLKNLTRPMPPLPLKVLGIDITLAGPPPSPSIAEPSVRRI